MRNGSSIALVLLGVLAVLIAQVRARPTGSNNFFGKRDGVRLVFTAWRVTPSVPAGVLPACALILRNHPFPSQVAAKAGDGVCF
jgi:hypothetical protein